MGLPTRQRAVLKGEWFPMPPAGLAVVPETPASPHYPGRMYAIVFDLDTKKLDEHYPGKTHTQGYADIGKFLKADGFGHQQQSVYFGNSAVTAVSCVLTVQEMVKEHPWVRYCVKDIRMLRIEENNDLGDAIDRVPIPSPAPEAGSLFDGMDANAA
jgi:virulence-associated protein VapD